MCPSGSHLPSDEEWTTLTDLLDGKTIAGGKLKETGTTHWKTPNNLATNESKFFGLPGGCTNIDGTFAYMGDYGLWWSATDNNEDKAFSRLVSFNDDDILRGLDDKIMGMSVRCIIDSILSNSATK